MKAKKTYTFPETEIMTVDTHGSVMQELFSGGDRITGIIVGLEADDSEEDNRSNEWSSHLWEDME